jgi:hypothetical protein
MEPSGPFKACNGIALPLHLHKSVRVFGNWGTILSRKKM